MLPVRRSLRGAGGAAVLDPASDLPERCLRLVVGARTYVIDFKLMIQLDAADSTKKRRLQRSKKEEVLEEFQKGKSKGTKGQGGVMFVRTRSLRAR